MTARRTSAVLLALLLVALLLAPTSAGADGLGPTAVDDRYRTHPDEVLSPTRSVLRNDTDPEGDTLTAELNSGPLWGTVDLQPDGRFTYTPPAGFEGLDQFTYRVSDGTTQSFYWGYVTIEVNTPPIAVDDHYPTLKNKRVIIDVPGVMANDIDTSGGKLRVRLVNGAQHGTLHLTGLGYVRYKPFHGFVGTDTFTYQVSDGEYLSNVATVTIDVRDGNTAPVAVPDTFDLGEDTWLELGAPGLMANDTDADGDALTAEIVQYPFFGNLYMDPDGYLVYEPYPDFDSDVTFTYRVFDGIAWSEPVEVYIDMYAINDPPYAEDDYFGMNADTVLEVGSPGVLGNDYDPVEGDNLTASLGFGPANGEVTLEADGSFTYTPDPGFFGWDSFSYLACDPGGCAGASATIEVFEPF